MLHEGDVFHIRADAAENAEDGLNEEGRLDQSAVNEMRKVIEVPDVVALVLETRPASFAEMLENVGDVAERVA